LMDVAQDHTPLDIVPMITELYEPLKKKKFYWKMEYC